MRYVKCEMWNYESVLLYILLLTVSGVSSIFPTKQNKTKQTDAVQNTASNTPTPFMLATKKIDESMCSEMFALCEIRTINS